MWPNIRNRNSIPTKAFHYCFFFYLFSSLAMHSYGRDGRPCDRMSTQVSNASYACANQIICLFLVCELRVKVRRIGHRVSSARTHKRTSPVTTKKSPLLTLHWRSGTTGKFKIVRRRAIWACGIFAICSILMMNDLWHWQTRTIQNRFFFLLSSLLWWERVRSWRVFIQMMILHWQWCATNWLYLFGTAVNHRAPNTIHWNRSTHTYDYEIIKYECGVIVYEMECVCVAVARVRFRNDTPQINCNIVWWIEIGNATSHLVADRMRNCSELRNFVSLIFSARDDNKKNIPKNM